MLGTSEYTPQLVPPIGTTLDVQFADQLFYRGTVVKVATDPHNFMVDFDDGDASYELSVTGTVYHVLKVPCWHSLVLWHEAQKLSVCAGTLSSEAVTNTHARASVIF